MPKRKTPEEKPEEQFKRFVEVAKDHGIDDGGKDAERAFVALITKRSKHPPKR